MSITPQHVFDAAWKAFVLDDKPPGTSYHGGCLYLTADGNRCAFGHAIPDGNMALEFDGSAGELLKNFPSLFDEEDWKEVDADSLQLALHDALVSRGKWKPEYCAQEKRKQHYIQAAKRYGLVVPEEGT